MRKIKRITSIILAALMVMSLFAAVPMTVNAGSPGDSGAGTNIGGSTTVITPATTPTFVAVTDENQIDEENIGTCTASEAIEWLEANLDDITSGNARGNIVFYDENGTLSFFRFFSEMYCDSSLKAYTSLDQEKFNYSEGKPIYICSNGSGSGSGSGSTPSVLPDVIKDCTYHLAYPAYPPKVYANKPFIQGGGDDSFFLDGAIQFSTNTHIGFTFDTKEYSYKFYNEEGTEVSATLTASETLPSDYYELPSDVTVYRNSYDFPNDVSDPIYIVASEPGSGSGSGSAHEHTWDTSNITWTATYDGFDATLTAHVPCTGCDVVEDFEGTVGMFGVEEAGYSNCSEEAYDTVSGYVTIGGVDYSSGPIVANTYPADPTAHPYELTHYPATAATYNSEGNTEYWYCGACEKYFSDEEGTQEIAENSWVIPMLTGAVAEIDGYKYATLQEAIDATQAGDTVKLLNDVTETVTISGKTLTLDLYGFNITSASKDMPITAIDGTKLTIVNSNTAKAENTATQNAIMGPSGSNNKGSLNAKGEGTTVDIYAGYYYGYNGNKTAINAINGAKVTFWGGTVNGAEGIDDTTAGKEGKVFYSGVSNPNLPYDTTPGYIVVHGGTFSGRMSDSNWGNYTIDGGTFDRNEVVLNENPVDANGNRVATANKSMATLPNSPGTLEEAGWLADGYMIVPNGNGTFGVAGPYAAKVGNTGYATITDARDAALNTENPVVLLKDATYNGRIAIKGDVTFDLNGFELKSTGSKGLFIISEDGSLTVKNGTISADATQVVYNTNGTFILESDATVENKSNGSGLGYYSKNAEANAVISGTIQAYNGIQLDDSATATIKDGAVIDATLSGIALFSASQDLSTTAGSVVIEGGTITGRNGIYIADGGSVTITGGEVTATDNLVLVLNSPTPSTVEISGGLFNKVVPEEYCAENFVPVTTPNSNGMYTVTAAPFDYVTKGNDGYYFNDSIDLGSGDTLAQANSYTSLFNLKILGVQKKTEQDTLTSDSGRDMRFVTVVNTDILKDAEEYGYVFAKFNNKEAARIHANEILVGAPRTITKKCTGTDNTISEGYGIYDTDTAYKYVTASVNGVDDGYAVAARFYVRKGNTYYYADYTNKNNQTYNVCAAAYSDLA